MIEKSKIRICLLAVAVVSVLLLAGCGGGTSAVTGTTNQSSASVARWQPQPTDSWQWQLSGTVNPGYDVVVYDIDLFDTPVATIQALQASGKKVVCYFSAGSAENWRSDYRSFQPADLGSDLDGWAGERWLDTRSSNVRQVMRKRLDLAVSKGCDGIEPDNVDAYINNPGFPLTADTQLDFNRFLAQEAHSRNLAVGLKNDVDQIVQLGGDFDFAVNEQCHEFNECAAYDAFIASGKPVFNSEYSSSYLGATSVARDAMCASARAQDMRTLVLPLVLDDRFRYSCDPDHHGPPAGYQLVWSDEFNGDGLPDSTKWGYDTEANATGWYNNELQYYSAARLENSRISDGKLIITARKEALTSEPDYGGQQYTSARLITRDKASWTYGFYDIRAKLPCGLGTWPAIWTLGVYGAWPAGGEIDIMEQVGKEPTLIYGTIHNQSTAGTSGNGGVTELKDACHNFHNYQLTWTPQSLQIGVDDVVFHTYTNDGTGTASWPFDQPQYLLLNLAIGGDWGGPVDDSIFPAQMEIDYARVYQKP